MMTPDPNQLWRIPLEADLRHREWEGEHVFFHGGAGDTHRFSEAAALVLLHLMTTPTSEAELATLLSEAAEVDLAEAEAALNNVLAELDRIEYAEPVQ